MELKASMVRCVALALAVVMLAAVAASAMPEIAATVMPASTTANIGASRVEVIIDCSQPDCTNKCLAAYGAKLIQAICQVLPVGKLCVCQHKP
ncbi:hypothetical protein ACJRO7_004007 [Eucalyptus globulus]|uniref:Uncharacterized protein n=1 Tax=Eucalyptus globulus TaxID=34317 RepID=A0ABD3IW46_EUCGL